MSSSDCIQSTYTTEPCDVCHQPAEIIHLPRRPFGFFCEQHCPVCSVEVKEAPIVAHVVAVHSPTGRVAS